MLVCWSMYVKFMRAATTTSTTRVELQVLVDLCVCIVESIISARSSFAHSFAAAAAHTIQILYTHSSAQNVAYLNNIILSPHISSSSVFFSSCQQSKHTLLSIINRGVSWVLRRQQRQRRSTKIRQDATHTIIQKNTITLDRAKLDLKLEFNRFFSLFKFQLYIRVLFKHHNYDDESRLLWATV